MTAVKDHATSCWTESGRGFKYKSAIGPIQKLILKASEKPSKAKIRLHGKGIGLLGDPFSVPLAQPVTMRLVNEYGECWEATFSAPAAKNENGVLRDRSD